MKLDDVIILYPDKLISIFKEKEYIIKDISDVYNFINLNVGSKRKILLIRNNMTVPDMTNFNFNFSIGSINDNYLNVVKFSLDGIIFNFSRINNRIGPDTRVQKLSNLTKKNTSNIKLSEYKKLVKSNEEFKLLIKCLNDEPVPELVLSNKFIILKNSFNEKKKKLISSNKAINNSLNNQLISLDSQYRRFIVKSHVPRDFIQRKKLLENNIKRNETTFKNEMKLLLDEFSRNLDDYDSYILENRIEIERKRKEEIAREEELKRQAELKKHQEADRLAKLREKAEREKQAEIKKLEEKKAAMIKRQEELKRIAEAKRQAEIKKQQEEEVRRQAEIKKQQEEEVRRQAELKKQQEEEVRRQAELKKQQEEEAKRQAELKKQQEEEAKRQAEIKNTNNQLKYKFELQRQLAIKKQLELNRISKKAEAERLASEKAEAERLEIQFKIKNNIIEQINNACYVIVDDDNMIKQFKENNNNVKLNFKFIKKVDSKQCISIYKNQRNSSFDKFHSVDDVVYLKTTIIAMMGLVKSNSSYGMIVDGDTVFDEKFMDKFNKLEIKDDFNVLRLTSDDNNDCVECDKDTVDTRAIIYNMDYVKRKLLNFCNKFVGKYTYTLNNVPKSYIVGGELVDTINNGDMNKFVMIITSCNNSKWYVKNLDSVVNQIYKNWRIVYVDDCSTDNTYELVKEYIRNKNIENKVTLIRNEGNMKQSYSRYTAFKECNDDEICCLLDGDDWLYDNNVLKKLNKVYNMNDCMVTYSDFIRYHKEKLGQIVKSQEYSDDIKKNSMYRNSNWLCTPLRTGYAKLFKNIMEEEMKDYNGDWLKCSTDMAIMYNVMEQSKGKIKVINDVMYVYNIDNSTNYDSSYYNKNTEFNKYREQVGKHLKYENYSGNQLDFLRYLEENNISMIKLSRSLNNFSRIKPMYNLKDCNDTSKPCLFFGVYNMNEYNTIINHKDDKYLMFAGTDCDDRIDIHKGILNKLKEHKDIKFISISNNMSSRLKKYDIKFEEIKLDLTNYKIFKPPNNLGKCIYVYDGNGNITDRKKLVYNYEMINKVKEMLPEYEYIYSSKLNVNYIDMPEIYSKCFIGLRLTSNDGNANTVMEFKAMNIPIVHNNSEYGLKWENVDDIVNHIKENNYEDNEINMFELNQLEDRTLKIVNRNIRKFDSNIQTFKNILFVCGDYPGYGGSATNCHELAKYYMKKGHNVFEFYFNYDRNNRKYERKSNIWIEDLNKIRNINFKPDIIILKSPLKINIKSIFKCPIYYLVGGIYKNELDKNYQLLSDEENQKYINQSVINQIKNVDKTFVNSSHTADILLEKFNLKSEIFYSSFVPFIYKKIIIDNNFENRKYEYGLIVSNFDRKIKNVEKSVEFLKDKENVILIGKNSNKYKDLGFECIDLVDKDKMMEYYKEIKYIVQDSFYDSCSNVKIEGLFNSCKIYSFVNIDYKNLDGNIILKKQKKYIIGNKTYFYENVDNYFKLDSLEGYFINQYQTKEIIIFAYLSKDITVKKVDLLKKINLNNKKIGFNKNTYSKIELNNMYYMYGLSNININYIGLGLFYNIYVEKLKDPNSKFNKLILPLFYSYYYGNNRKKYDYDLMKKKIDNLKYHEKDVLLLSKILVNFGGVQKSSEQIISILDKKYNVFILSNYLRGNKYDFKLDQINDSIPNILIIKINDLKKIGDFINKSNYEFIINNKLDNILNLNVNKKINYICHNSMDSLNKLLIVNSNKIDKLFTVNNFHKKLLYLNNFDRPIYKFNIYVNDDKILKKRQKTEFNYNIGFIGRLSKEKNVQHLINSVNEFNKINKFKINLYLIGDGKIKFTNLNDNIKFLGKLNFDEILSYYNIFDYVISASLTEGKPFSIIEALKYGIPCIHSKINGIDEIIFDKINGFLFNLDEYDKIKFDLKFDNIFKLKLKNDNLVKCLKDAYSISIEKWNQMSQNCQILFSNENDKKFCFNKNLDIFEIDYNKKYIRKKIFVNFKPDENIPYGGGNISVSYLINNLCDKYSDFIVTYELEEDINIYLVIDPIKDNKFKKYSLKDIVNHRNEINKSGKIFIRVNDCDKTRIIDNVERSREYHINLHYNDIDYFIYNSKFIKSYYLEKYEHLAIKKNIVIINGCDENIFYPEYKKIDDKIKIVTHHWSNNLNKGYETYYKLWKYCKNIKNMEFVFIGKNVPEMFKEVPINGPFVKESLSKELNKCHIYITDSKYDSCPNHVLEAISCEIPILYSNYEGGARELCQMPELKIGEIFNNFDELIEKIDLIKNNYDFYIKNIKKVKFLYNIKNCINKYKNIFLENIDYEDSLYLELKYSKAIIKINCPDNNSYIIINNNAIRLLKGENLFAINKIKYNKIKLINNVKKLNITIDQFLKNNNKLDNGKKLNILYCSDSNYFVGLFANLHSLFSNISNLDDININFMIPLEKDNKFSSMLLDFESKINYVFNKSIIYIDDNIIDPIIYSSKCYNGGGHLLNLGNLSRLLIGEFMNYKKLLYLDADSIIQNDIFKKLLNFNLKYPIYSACANLENINNKKRLVIKMSSIINCDYNWEKIIGENINKDDFVFMGAPFLTDCRKWYNIYHKIIKIINIHNSTEGGVYKLFTMSLQNILFYKKTGDINSVLNVLQDLGSKRKNWEKNDLINKDILDWSGIFKPWFKNGLYRNLWLCHDIMNLSESYSSVISSKNIIESFADKKLQNVIVDKEYLNVSNDIYKEFDKYLRNIIYRNKSKIKYNILFVCDSKYLLNKMSRVRFWAIEELGRKHNVNLDLTGPGFINFNNKISLQENILNFNKKFDMVIWYKPLNENYNFDYKVKLPFKTCLRYNEMWDEKWTKKEIDETKTDIIICHHYNDYLKYKNIIYKNDWNKEFYYNPHHSNPDIFKNLNEEKDIDILLSGVAKEKHYPFKFRLFNLILKHRKTTLKDFNIYHHKHPGYNNYNSFKNVNQINYNKYINKSKICIACTSRYNYRLGKYVEIPMAGSLICGDLPYEDKKNFKEFIIDISQEMTDKEILDKLIYYLMNQNLIDEKIKFGLEWSKNYTTSVYVDNILKILSENKIFIISDEIRENHPEFNNQKWICDILKDEFMKKFPYNTTLNAKNANLIWYLAPWNSRYIPKNFKAKEWLEYLKTKKVVFTQHHIDEEKLKIGQLKKQFDFMKTYGHKYHAICELTKNRMKEFFNEKLISSKRLWINDNNFYHIPDKEKLRNKFNIDKNAYLVGSFQKDTEGNTDLPKLSKGPDIFIKIVNDIKLTNPNVQVLLTGLRRTYIINELKKANIKYYYFNMCTLEEINELYNCLDLYLVSSRVEGGPRAVFEAGLTRTPIISTRVGIAPELIARSSLFDYNKWKSYQRCRPNVELLYSNVLKLSTDKYMNEFYNYLLK